MLKLFRCVLLVFVSCSFVLSGCGFKNEGPADTGQRQLSQISCIAVLPVSSMSKGQVVPVYVPNEKNSRRGIQVMNKILSQELGGKNNIRFVGIDKVSSLELTGGENSLALASMVGKNMNCNAVLESTVKRFADRVGGRYSVESPASVAFEMRLISIETGSILWSAKFDEVQKSVMENIFEWNKANTRSFVWITADELMEEGVSGKLTTSPYFNLPGARDQSDSSL